MIILVFQLRFRLTCYYYRKAYYRSWWLSPPACAVPESRKRYTGETRFPLILQNIHRYLFYAALIFNVILTWDAIIAFDWHGSFGMGLGTLVLLANAVLLWLYRLSCHACRHAVGGRINHLSAHHPIPYRFWTLVTKINPYQATSPGRRRSGSVSLTATCGWSRAAPFMTRDSSERAHYL